MVQIKWTSQAKADLKDIADYKLMSSKEINILAIHHSARDLTKRKIK